MIGERVKRLRTQLGLSQSQLAGKEITRAFVSQIENGRCEPSPATLRVLAERLGKPLSYFLEEHADEDGVKLLWQSAKNAMSVREWPRALPNLEQALRLAKRTDDLQVQADIQFDYATCLAQLARPDEALDQYEEALELFGILANKICVLRTMLEIANCYFAMEQYSSARRMYEKIIKRSEGSKLASELQAVALCYLGSTLHLLGDYKASIGAFKQSLARTDKSMQPGLWGRIAGGLAASFLRFGRPEIAREWCKQALCIFPSDSSSDILWIQHNVALCEMRMGNWETGFSLLRRLFMRYQERNETELQAQVLDDLVEYWLHKGDLGQAESLCWQALDLACETGKARLRGLLYQHLGHIYRDRGELRRARELLLISYELLRSTRAANELKHTIQMIEDLGSRDRSEFAFTYKGIIHNIETAERSCSAPLSLSSSAPNRDGQPVL